jgi:hypothetical protein
MMFDAQKAAAERVIKRPSGLVHSMAVPRQVLSTGHPLGGSPSSRTGCRR